MCTDLSSPSLDAGRSSISGDEQKARRSSLDLDGEDRRYWDRLSSALLSAEQLVRFFQFIDRENAFDGLYAAGHEETLPQAELTERVSREYRRLRSAAFADSAENGYFHSDAWHPQMARIYRIIGIFGCVSLAVPHAPAGTEAFLALEAAKGLIDDVIRSTDHVLNDPDDEVCEGVLQ